MWLFKKNFFEFQQKKKILTFKFATKILQNFTQKIWLFHKYDNTTKNKKNR